MSKIVPSAFWKFWPAEAMIPGGLVVMSDRMYIVDPNGTLWRLPVGEAFNVKVS